MRAKSVRAPKIRKRESSSPRRRKNETPPVGAGGAEKNRAGTKKTDAEFDTSLALPKQVREFVDAIRAMDRSLKNAVGKQNVYQALQVQLVTARTETIAKLVALLCASEAEKVEKPADAGGGAS